MDDFVHEYAKLEKLVKLLKMVKMNYMTLPPRHRIRNLRPGDLRSNTVPLSN